MEHSSYWFNLGHPVKQTRDTEIVDFYYPWGEKATTVFCGESIPLPQDCDTTFTEDYRLCGNVNCDKVLNNMKKCANCKKVYYCSKECQLCSWGVHKIGCGLLKNGWWEDGKHWAAFFSVMLCSQIREWGTKRVFRAPTSGSSKVAFMYLPSRS